MPASSTFADRGVPDREVGPDHRHQPVVRVPHHPRRGARHEKAQMGPHHQHGVGAFAGRLAVQGGLRDGEARADRPDQDGRARARDLRRHLQLHQPRLCVDSRWWRSRSTRAKAAGQTEEEVKHEVLLAAKQPMQEFTSRSRSARSPSTWRRRRRQITGRPIFDRRRLDGGMNFLSRAFGGDKPDKPRTAKRINLALQGGGAHGAFTWGVLDHLLEDGRLGIEGISGASAGAVNAVMLADGLRAAGLRRRANVLPTSGARRASAATCRRCSARCRTAVLAGADRGFADFNWFDGLVALSLALRSQPAQHQSAQGPDRTLRRFRGVARRCAPDLHRGHQCAHRPAAYISARQYHRRGGDGLGLPAVRVSRGRDRRRALLGRRLSRQSGDLSVLPRDAGRGRADRADQPAGAQEIADLDARDHEPASTRSPSTRR